MFRPGYPKRRNRALLASHSGALDALIEEITVDAAGDDEKLWAFRQAFEEHIAVPCDAFIIGEPVSVVDFEYDGNARRGVTATCCRADGEEYVVSAVDVQLSPRADDEQYLAAYRKWLGLETERSQSAPTGSHRQHKAVAADVALGGPVELVALSIKERAARCRLLATIRIRTPSPSRTSSRTPAIHAVPTRS